MRVGSVAYGLSEYRKKKKKKLVPETRHTLNKKKCVAHRSYVGQDTREGEE